MYELIQEKENQRFLPALKKKLGVGAIGVSMLVGSILSGCDSSNHEIMITPTATEEMPKCTVPGKTNLDEDEPGCNLSPTGTPEATPDHCFIAGMEDKPFGVKATDPCVLQPS